MSSTGAQQNGANGHGDHDHILRPRAMKAAMNPALLRTQSSDSGMKTPGATDIHSGASSRAATPVPADAPPSVQSISSVRKQIRAQTKHRLFPTVEYSARVSHFDPKSTHSDFRGFFVLFWIALALMVVTTFLRNVKDTGYPLRVRPWALLTENVIQLGVSDLALVFSTVIVVPMQQLIRKNKAILRWNRLGMPLYSTFQVFWLINWVNWPFLLNWTWTAQVFFMLHTIVLLMKIHSYAFYNGHLSATENRLSALDKPENESTAAAVRYPSSSTRLNEITQDDINHREKTEAEKLKSLRDDLAMELTSPLGQVTYPQNLTYTNFADYILCPTLCYELEYPRTLDRSFLELFYKGLAVFGCIFLLTVTSEEFIVPVLNDASTKLENVSRISDQGLILAESISMLLFPFMITFLLTFLVIFEYILGAFAEITCFADRHFYSDWWNSCDWLEFSREWNIPVHNFLRRHIYAASVPYLSKSLAQALTFFISSLLHELIMGCITKKLRGYGFVAMMLQIPIVGIQRTKFFRGKALFNNIFFWISMILGLAVMCALYVLI